MSRGSKVLFWILFAIVAITITATFYRTMVLKEYDAYYDDYGEEAELLEEVAGEL